MRLTDPRRLSLLLPLALAIVAIMASTMIAYAQQTPPAPRPTRTGQQAFEQSCGFCHGQFGQGKLAVPNLAGASGHLQQMGVPQEGIVPRLMQLVRSGIPSRMPMFPPEALTDAEVANIGAYLLTLPPAQGTSIFLSNCAMCHGPAGEGIIGPLLNDAPEFIRSQGWTLDQTAAQVAELVHGGIPTRMPSFPQFTDTEIRRLAVFFIDFDQVGAWIAEFKAKQGHDPMIADFVDRAWSLEFAARFGRQPTAAEWAMHWAETHPSGPPGPPGS